LLYQLFKQSKVCKKSKYDSRFTDCLFKANGTEILLVGAIGTDIKTRFLGKLESGFRILSIDADAEVKVFYNEHLGTTLQVISKHHLEETGCIDNRAYISLNGDVLSPFELFELIYTSPSREEKLRLVQQYLKSIGLYKGNVDGVFGRKTKFAIDDFLKSQGLPPNTLFEDIYKRCVIPFTLKDFDELIEIIEKKDQ
jgi:hypothetical protein